jgi:UDP-glucose 4-epimerase
LLEGKKVLVTGGAGFIGSHLVDQLVARGAQVTVVDNLSTGSRENLKHLDAGTIDFLELDVRDPAIGEAVSGSDIIFHLACLGVRHSLHDPIENHGVNATGTISLIKACETADLERFVHVSSSEVYGTASVVPMTEQHPTFPCTVYGAAKLAGEAYARAAYRTYAFPSVIVRPFNAFGPRSHHEGDSGEVIPRMLLSALAGRSPSVFGSGEQTRDFTFVEDTARGIVLAAISGEVIGETLNIGSGSETSIASLAHKVRAVAGGGAPIEHFPPRPGDVERLCADSSAAYKKLGYKPKVSLDEGLERLRDWYLESDVSALQRLEQTVLFNWYKK